ncbi:MAG TPA: TIM-barrel domain-containing protein, partial [Verrucomicrobiae bacterium]|nr:TIM-barrel domain-containing protein [Verrucomicrobiae bacterium]
MKLFFHSLSSSLVASVCLVSSARAATAPATPEKVSDGMVVRQGDTFLKVEVWGDNVLRVAAAKDPSFFTNSTPATQVRQKKKVDWKMSTSGNTTTLSTSDLQARIDLTSGAVSFLDAKGKTILAETRDGRQIQPAEVQGEKTFHVEQQWEANPDESLYGLGQLQFGTVDIKGYDLDLWQHNTCVVVPLLVSSQGYGVYWDNLSFTRFGDQREWTPIPTNCLVDADGHLGGLTMGTFNANAPDQLQNTRVVPLITETPGRRGGRGGGWTRWQGEILATETGTHQIRVYSNGGIKMWINGQLVINHWRQNWLTENDQVKVVLEAGRHYAVRIEHGGDQATTLAVTWKTPSPNPATTLWSEVGNGVDYYFIYGPKIDRVIAGYRQLTGQASMMPEWSFGLWQSRNRYETSQQSIDVAKEFRKRQIPVDVIVQDWQYWKSDGWGTHQFDPARFPDPDAWVKAIHAEHDHLMISVWGKFYPGSSNFNALQSAGYLYQPDLDEHAMDWLNHP